MPEDKLPIPQFAAKIKAKYPQYKDVNDTLLVQRIVEKYPEYKESVDLSGIGEPEKKKIGGIGSLVGGAVGTSVPQSGKQKITDYLYGLKTKEEKQLAAPTTGITTTLKQKPKKLDEQALNTINTIMYEDGDRWKDPVKSIVEESKNVSKFEDLDVYNRAAELTRNSLAGSGYKAKVLLADTFLNAERDNMTASMLKNRAEQYDKISEPFRNLQFFEGNTITDNPDLDYNAKDKLYDAAIRAYANKYPLFGKQAQAAGIDLSSTDLRRKLGDKGYAGIVMSDILQDKDFVDFVQNENPKYLNVVQNAANDLLKDNREYGINVVANEISKERQKSGLNNPIVEFDDKRFMDETDLVAQKLYGNDPVKMQIYEEVIKRNPDQYLDTPSLLEGISQGAEGVYKGIGTSFEAPFTSISNQIKEGWEKEASNVTADPKGVSKFLSGTGHVLGLVGALGGIGNVIGGGGTGLYSQKIAPFLSGTVPFAGDFWKEAVMKYPDSPAKAALSTTLNTALYGALSQRIFPTKQVQQAFENVKPGIGQIVENLASGKITREVARREANTLIKQGFDFLKGTVSKSAKISAELTGITAANRALDKLFMDEQDFEKYHPENELQDSFKTLFLDNLVLGGMTKYSDIKKGNAIVEESLYEAATNPLRYKRVIDEMEVKDPTISKEDMLNNLGFLSMLKIDLDKRGVSEKNQKRYLFEAMKERAIKQQISEMPESNITRRGQEQIKRGEEIKDAILNGEDAENVLTEADRKEAEEINKAQAEKNKLTEKGQKAVDKLLEQKDEEDKPVFKGMYRDIAKADPMGFLQEVADQVFGMERINGERVKSKSEPPSEESIVKRYTADVVNAAKELFPLEAEKSEIDQQRDLDMGTEPVSEPATLKNTPSVKDISDFSNENEFYRVVVGDKAFRDIVENGVVRVGTSEEKAAKTKLAQETGAINLDRSGTTAYPSFSKGKASISYAKENPNNYIIVTSDESIKPSTSGRHGKGTTMFPTNESGKHLEELDAKKVQVYKHTGGGRYELVYDKGQLVEGRKSEPPSISVQMPQEVSKPQTTEIKPAETTALKDVESTAKALETESKNKPTIWEQVKNAAKNIVEGIKNIGKSEYEKRRKLVDDIEFNDYPSDKEGEIILKKDGKNIGSMDLHYGADGLLHIKWVKINKEFQGKGLSLLLYGKATEIAAQKGLKGVGTGFVTHSTTKTQGIYKHFNFTELGESKGSMEEGVKGRKVILHSLKDGNENNSISEAYHADKAAGKETDLTKAVESLLSKEQPKPAETKPAESIDEDMTAFVEVTRPELGFEELPTDILDNMDSKTMAVQGKRLEGLNKNLSKLQELFNCIWT